MELTKQFEEAAAISKTLPSKPSNDTLLKIYALYKQALEGDAGSEAPSNSFDFVARAKYTAWAELKRKTKETAMEEYIDLIAKLKS